VLERGELSATVQTVEQFPVSPFEFASDRVGLRRDRVSRSAQVPWICHGLASDREMIGVSPESDSSLETDPALK